MRLETIRSLLRTTKGNAWTDIDGLRLHVMKTQLIETLEQKFGKTDETFLHFNSDTLELTLSSTPAPAMPVSVLDI
jgi:hypothetical protein